MIVYDIKAIQCMYTVVRTAAPTQNSQTALKKPKPRPHELGWPDFEPDVQRLILDKIPLGTQGTYKQSFKLEKPAQTTEVSWEDRDLEDVSVECEIEWIFERHRKDIFNLNNSLEVTMKRSLLPEQTSDCWKRLTPEEQIVVKNTLEYEHKWTNVLSIKLISNFWNYQLQFLLNPDKDNYTVSHAPDWATWGRNRTSYVLSHLPDELLLSYHRSAPETDTDIIYLETQPVTWPADD
jgi:hypothetical protein